MRNIFVGQIKKLFKESINKLLPKPKSTQDEAVTWTLWAVVAGAVIPSIILAASVIWNMQLTHENSGILLDTLKKILEKNLLLYFSIEIIIAATADYYILSLKNYDSTKDNESFLATSLKYGIFPMLLFTVSLITLFMSSVDKSREMDELLFHIIIFMVTIFYVFIVKHRCGCISEGNISSHNSSSSTS